MFVMMIETNNKCKFMINNSDYSFVLNNSIDSLFDVKECNDKTFDLSKQQTSLFYSCIHHQSIKILRYLLSLTNIAQNFDNNNDIKQHVEFSFTPLMTAVDNKNVEMVKLLLPHVHDINATYKTTSFTALYWACN